MFIIRKEGPLFKILLKGSGANSDVHVYNLVALTLEEAEHKRQAAYMIHELIKLRSCVETFDSDIVRECFPYIQELCHSSWVAHQRDWFTEEKEAKLKLTNGKEYIPVKY